MGSIVGGLYAAGYSPDELEEIVTTVDWDTTFTDSTPRQEKSFRRKRDDDLYLIKSKPGLSDDLELEFPSGLVQGQKVDLLFEKLTLPVAGINDFDRLQIPFRAVATDIGTGEGVVLGSGSLSQAMRASMSVPGGFAAVEIDGHKLVDGGMANNLPVDVARDLCADVIIAVDISTPLMPAEEIKSVFSVTLQLTGFLTRRNTEAQIASLGDRDILIVPDLGDFGSSDFNEVDKVIPIGQAAAEAAVPRLAALALDEKAYATYRSGRPSDALARTPPVIDFIRIENASSLGEEVINEYTTRGQSIQVGQPLDVAILEKEIARLYGLELFESIRYDIVEENGQHGVVVHVRERQWGPNYLQAGLDWATDMNGESVFNLGFAYTRTLINELNGELRIAGQIGDDPALSIDIYQPLDPGQRWYVGGALGLGSFNSSIFARDSELAEFRVKQRTASVFAGRNLGDWGSMRLILRRDIGNTDLRIGDPTTFTDYDFDLGRVQALLLADNLDSLNFPRQGQLLGIEWSGAREGLGSDSEFDQVELLAGIPYTWGRNTVIVGAAYKTTLDDDAPFEALFRAGGFLRLSGFQTDQLAGQHYGQASVLYYRKVNDFSFLPVYLGASLEGGNVWQRESAIFDDVIMAGSAFVGLDTPIGPMFLAYGVADGGHQSFYLTLGKPVLIRRR